MIRARGAALMFAVLSSLLVAGRASAQPACTDGRVRAAETRGRCCWPGQVWARDIGRCEGPPSCPSGLASEGDDCVPAVVPHTPAPIAPAPVAPRGPVITPIPAGGPIPPTGSGPTATAPRLSGPASWPSAPSSGPPGLVNPHWVEEATDSSLITAGVVLLAIGYLDQLVGAIGHGTSDTRNWAGGSIYHYDIVDYSTGVERTVGSFNDHSCRDAIAGTLAVPVLGPIISGAVLASCRVPHYTWSETSNRVVSDYSNGDGNAGWVVAAAPGALLVLIGAILVPVGLGTSRRAVHTSAAGLSVDLGGTRLSLTSHVPGANAGVALRLDF